MWLINLHPSLYLPHRSERLGFAAYNLLGFATRGSINLHQLISISAAQASERLAEVLSRAAAALPATEPLWRQRLGRALALELPLSTLLEAEVRVGLGLGSGSGLGRG